MMDKQLLTPQDTQNTDKARYQVVWDFFGVKRLEHYESVYVYCYDLEKMTHTCLSTSSYTRLVPVSYAQDFAYYSILLFSSSNLFFFSRHLFYT